MYIHRNEMKKIVLAMTMAVVLCQGAAAASKVQTMLLLGDGTMAVNTRTETPQAYGWGEEMGQYLQGMQVVNDAYPQMSVLSLMDNINDLDAKLEQYGRKDILLLQCGQNDLNETRDDMHSTVEELIQRLTKVIEVAQDKKMRIILCTPLAEPFFMDGQLIDRLGAYPQAIRNLAGNKQLPLLDLEAATRQWISDLGEEGVKAYYVNLDTEHSPAGEYLLNEAGAKAVSKMAAEGLKALNLKYLKKVLVVEGNTATADATK